MESIQVDRTIRIALTGGPGGGKTTAADLIRRELGERIVIVPETATMLFSSGFPRSRERFAQVSAQKAIYHVQKNIEEAQHWLYPKRVLLCDRGTIDGAAYWPEGAHGFFKALGTSLEEELNRYDAVIFFESAAVGGIKIEGGNPTRIEDNATAQEIDRQLLKIWSQHSCFLHVPHQQSFLAKIQGAVEATRSVLKRLNGNHCS